ncbi:MAG: hypothetical protein ACE5FN_02435 [Leptospirillia bacterium]
MTLQPLGRPLALALAVLLVTGCATVRKPLPVPTAGAEFTRPLAELEVDYAVIGQYQPGFSGIFRHHPRIGQLEQAWGPPAQVETRYGRYLAGGSAILGTLALMYDLTTTGWVLGAGFVFLVVLPFEEYVWEKGDYRIRVIVSRGLVDGYRRRLVAWKWEQRGGTPD